MSDPGSPNTPTQPEPDVKAHDFLECTVRMIEIPDATRPRVEVLAAAADQRVEVRDGEFWMNRLDGKGWFTAPVMRAVLKEAARLGFIAFELDGRVVVTDLGRIAQAEWEK